MLGSIAGPGAVVEPAGVRFYGTDLGWTFEHRGQHFMLFGDTWPHPRSPCDPLPHNDDSQVTFPLDAAPGPADADRRHRSRGAERVRAHPSPA